MEKNKELIKEIDCKYNELEWYFEYYYKEEGSNTNYVELTINRFVEVMSGLFKEYYEGNINDIYEINFYLEQEFVKESLFDFFENKLINAFDMENKKINTPFILLMLRLDVGDLEFFYKLLSIFVNVVMEEIKKQHYYKDIKELYIMNTKF